MSSTIKKPSEDMKGALGRAEQATARVVYNDLPPPPYSYETITAKGRPEGSGHVYLIDANGRKIASIWGRQEEKMALAELICNAGDRLRKVEASSPLVKGSE